MPTNAQELYDRVIRTLSPTEQLRLANLILNELVQRDVSVVDRSDTWTEQDLADLANYSLQYAATFFSEDEEVV